MRLLLLRGGASELGIGKVDGRLDFYEEALEFFSESREVVVKNYSLHYLPWLKCTNCFAAVSSSIEGQL